MKKYNSIPKIIALVFLLVLAIQGCKERNNPDPLTVQLNRLGQTWQLGEVVNDGINVTDKFTGFTLTITTNKSFTTLNGANAWPASGTFEFIGDNKNILLRSDGLEITILSINATNLQLTFTQTELPGGRTSGITGEFNFSLIN